MACEILDWLVPQHAAWVIQRLERDVFPWLGSRPVAEITGLSCS